MARRRKWSKKYEEEKKISFFKRVEENMGIVIPVLKELGIPYKKYQEWCLDEEFLYEMNTIQEGAVQYVENKLFDLIHQGDKTAIIFFLKTRCKEKYSEQQNIQIDHQKEIEINILPPSDDSKNLEGPDGNGNLKIKK